MARMIGDVDELLAAVRHAARQEAGRVEREARAEAERIEEEARRDAEELRERQVAEARRSAERTARRELAEAGGEAKRRYLKAREELIGEAWHRAEESLGELTGNGDRYVEALRRLALLAARRLGGGAVVLASDGAGHELLTDERLEEWAREVEGVEKSAFERADEPADIRGGLVASEKNGRRRVDLSFAARLARAREELRGEIFRELVE